MPSIFEDYLSGLDVNTGGEFGASQGAQYGPTGKRESGSGNWVREGYAPSFQYIKEGSEAAAGLLRRGREEQFRSRAAGFAGAQSEMERGYGGQIASQGLSPDVAARMLLEQRTGGIQHLAEARGDAAYGLNTDLAGLAKGTSTEFAGLNRDQFSTLVNYLMAKKGLKAGKDAGWMNIAGSLIGAGGQVAAAAMPAAGMAPSDPRLKKNAIVVGVVKLVDGAIPVYEYEYKDPQIPGIYRGVMAPDVEHLGVVGVSKSGFKYVDYMKLEDLTGITFRKVGEVPNRRRRRAKTAKV